MYSRRPPTFSLPTRLDLDELDASLPLPPPTPSGMITMTPHESRPSTSVPTAMGKLFPRRTYSASKVRSLALITAAGLSFVAIAFVLYSWFSSTSSAREQYQRNHQMLRRDQQPLSRTFRYNSDVRGQQPTAVSSYSFAQHPDMELGALVNFLSLLASNSLPLTIDPAKHIDPELVLEFNTHAGDEKVQHEVETVVQDTWTSTPVVIFSELHSTAAPGSREAKKIIADYQLRPAPIVFEVDQRVDADVLRPLLSRLSGARSLPIVLIAGQPYDLDGLRAARENDSLTAAIRQSAATIGGANLGKKKKH